MMSRPSRRHFLQGSLTLAGLGLLSSCGLLPPQLAPAAKVPRIGFLSATSPSSIAARAEAFRQGLRELGYVEGESIVVESRHAVGELDRLNELAAELVRLKVDVILATGPTSTQAAKEATSTIPIVMAFHSDPVGSGLVASLAHPGGNVTGLSTLAPEISGKQLEFLKEIVPGFSRVTFFGTSTEPGNVETLRGTEVAVGALGLQAQYVDIVGPDDIERAFQAASKGLADAVLMLVSPILNAHRTQVVELAEKSRLPAMYPTPDFVEDGGLMSYGVRFTDLFRRAATYVDKILKGAKPADLPVEQPTKFDLVINLKTARALGLTIPQSVLLQATDVIQ